VTDAGTTPEDESKAAAIDQYRLIESQQEGYDWRTKMIDLGDYIAVFVRIQRLAGRVFVMRLRFDDYPEIAPELRFVAPEVFDAPSESAAPEERFYPTGQSIVGANQGRGPLPVPCIIGHRDYYAAGWHGGWSNPPGHEQSPYQLVMNVRNAILNVWS
jgi:hypothetical protein